MKTIFTEKSVVFENVPIEKGGLVIYAGTAKKFTKKKTLMNAQSRCFASYLGCYWSSSCRRSPSFIRSRLATRKWGVCWCCGKD